MSLIDFFSAQSQNPSGRFGRWVMPLVFDLGNARLNRLMKERLQVRAGQWILEIGCGAGKFIRRVAPLIGPGLVEGVDLSAAMTALAQKRNREFIAAGRVKIHGGDFNELAFPEDSYDAVCSCNAIYFWPEPMTTLRKVHSILKPGGRAALAFEDEARFAAKPVSRAVFRVYAQADIKYFFRESGFDGEVDILEAPGASGGFCCAVARKRAPGPEP